MPYTLTIDTANSRIRWRLNDEVGTAGTGNDGIASDWDAILAACQILTRMHTDRLRPPPGSFGPVLTITAQASTVNALNARSAIAADAVAAMQAIAGGQWIAQVP